jgi:ATP-dependent 26S proteasome regulatory subunit
MKLLLSPFQKKFFGTNVPFYFENSLYNYRWKECLDRQSGNLVIGSHEFETIRDERVLEFPPFNPHPEKASILITGILDAFDSNNMIKTLCVTGYIEQDVDIAIEELSLPFFSIKKPLWTEKVNEPAVEFIANVNESKGLIIIEDLDFMNSSDVDRLLSYYLPMVKDLLTPNVLILVLYNGNRFKQKLLKSHHIDRWINYELPDDLERRRIFQDNGCNPDAAMITSGFSRCQLLSLIDQSKCTGFDVLELARERTDESFYVTEWSNVSLDDVYGNSNAKETIKKWVFFNFKVPQSLSQFGIDNYSKGLLISGDGGCGKTMIVHAILNECKALSSILFVQTGLLFSKYLGDSEQRLRNLFQAARKKSPCILVFENIEAIGSKRDLGSESTKVSDRMLTTLLNEMDGIESKAESRVFVIGTCRDKSNVDEALIRPGRLETVLDLEPRLDPKEKRMLLEKRFKNVSDTDVELVVNGSDVSKLFKIYDLLEGCSFEKAMKLTKLKI